MPTCPLCGAADATCGGPSNPDLEVTDVVVNVPRIVERIADDPREMVRVQFSERDTRSYTRLEAEKLLAGGNFPDAFIVGDQDVKDAAAKGSERLSGKGSTFEEAADDLKGKAKARSAPNKSRTTKPAEQTKPPAATGSEPPSGTPPATDPAGQAGTKGDAGAGTTDS